MPKVKGIIVTTDKQVTEVEVDGLDDFQKIVGGMIEPVTLHDESTMYVNEEGKIFGLPFNSIATDVANLSRAIQFGDVIAGDVLIVGPVDGEGYDTDVTPWARQQVARVAREA